MKDGKVVKGIQFVNLRDAGDPVMNAQFYEHEGADELAILDISATIEGRKTRRQWVKAILTVITIPLTVGGGISSLEDMQYLFNLGVSKVSINSAAVQNPDLILHASQRFGRERIVVAIDGSRNQKMPSDFEVIIRGGTTGTGIDAVKWAKRCETLGAGELLLTSKDADGTQTGYDLEFTKRISDVVTIPTIASGGVGTVQHLYEGVVKGGATTLLAASIFHFRKLSIRDVKSYLKEKGLQVNL
jgi:cyclase